MTLANKNRFTVISNNEHTEAVSIKEKHKSYQTNPLKEQLVRFVNTDKFSANDLLKW